MNEILDVICNDDIDSDIGLKGEIDASTDWKYESEDNGETEPVFVQSAYNLIKKIFLHK